MYGGHIVNDFDRKMCSTYLDFFMKDELLDETEMYPYNDEEKSLSFLCPTPTTYDKYLEHIEVTLTQDTPIAFGLHPNAEIDFRTTQSNRILATILELQPRDSGGDFLCSLLMPYWLGLCVLRRKCRQNRLYETLFHTVIILSKHHHHHQVERGHFPRMK
jgi:hypothetical protein